MRLKTAPLPSRANGKAKRQSVQSPKRSGTSFSMSSAFHGGELLFRRAGQEALPLFEKGGTGGGFIRDEPSAGKYIRQFVGSDEFLNSIDRWCLWLKGISPSDLKSMPLVLKRVEAVKEMRLASVKEPTRELAGVSELFLPKIGNQTRLHHCS